MTHTAVIGTLAETVTGTEATAMIGTGKTVTKDAAAVPALRRRRRDVTSVLVPHHRVRTMMTGGESVTTRLTGVAMMARSVMSVIVVSMTGQAGPTVMQDGPVKG